MSFITVSGGLYTEIQSRQNANETSVAVIPDTGTARTSFENRSKMFRRNTFPVLVSVSGPRRSMDMLAKEPVTGNNMRTAVRRLDARLLRAHDVQLAMQPNTTADMESQ